MLVPMHRYASIRETNSPGRSVALAQRQERALRVGVGEHARRRDLLAARQPHTRRRGRPGSRCRSTSASHRISAPASRAASAIVAVSTPMPPRTNPHWRTPPSASSLAWSCSSTYAVPGVDGPATLSLIACQPSAAFTCSLSNRSDRNWFALVENRYARSARCLRCRRPMRPHFARAPRSLSERTRGSGAVQLNEGSTACTSSARSSSNRGRARASAVENRFVASTFSAMSSPR